MGSANFLVAGDVKLWDVVSGAGDGPSAAAAKFVAFCKDRFGDHCSEVMCKRVFPRLTREERAALGVQRVVQRPGDLIVTRPGSVLHWTLSTGPSICESVNFFVPVREVRTLQEGATQHLKLLRETGASKAWVDTAKGFLKDAKVVDEKAGRGLL